MIAITLSASRPPIIASRHRAGHGSASASSSDCLHLTAKYLHHSLSSAVLDPFPRYSR